MIISISHRLCQSKTLLQRSQFKSLIHEAEMDIKACANCCDAYLKKNGAVRVIKRTLWREALARYAARIEHHRSVIMNLLLMQAAVSGRDVTVAECVSQVFMIIIFFSS